MDKLKPSGGGTIEDAVISELPKFPHRQDDDGVDSFLDAGDALE